ncbi:MAG TPA: MarR family winged helix-turn-helix transcriptional regulator [Acidobacteriaceae bacterium]|jgi:DNA-binding MarR family transcriptional regulator|nr:MarR family winged helix-turn-helix transcriptional regulator [Acidobacteriaceae bacterium]
MNQKTIPVLPCMCANFRRSSRALTQMYDEAMRPLGMRGTQFTLLQALSVTGEIPQGDLGEILAMDSTTLTRTLEILGRRGWVSKRQGKDQRERWLRLTPAGQAQFNDALPDWQKVQARLRRQLGRERWDTLLQLTQDVTAAAIE